MTLSTSLRAIFERNADEYDRRVSVLEQAVAAILSGTLDEDLRATAERDAHKLAGSLGTFGLPRGSELAGALERRLGQPASAEADDSWLAECVAALRRELERDPAEAADAASVSEGGPATGRADAGRDLRRERFETGLAATGPVALTSGRILVVDDDVAVREALASILSDAGYDVHAVGSAREARLALDHEPIALLLSDVSMPGETGLDLIRFALCEYPGTATLLISALEDPGIAQVAIDFGAYGYLDKPVRRSAVLIGVMNALRRRDMEAGERAARETLEQTVKLRTKALSEALERLEEADSQRRELQAETFHRWARAAEHREPGIDRHLVRVSCYCAVLARRLGLQPEVLALASVLHDIGKGGVPDHILLKREPLTDDECFAIETHAGIGHEMLCDSASSLLGLAAQIAWTHHEKFDGSGYPRGLSGADIPLEGRIVAVADVFEALTSDSVARPAWSVDATIAWMQRERGKHFDPAVLDALLASMDEILAVGAIV